jgi:hypothetical protein
MGINVALPRTAIVRSDVWERAMRTTIKARRAAASNAKKQWKQEEEVDDPHQLSLAGIGHRDTQRDDKSCEGQKVHKKRDDSQHRIHCISTPSMHL